MAHNEERDDQLDHQLKDGLRAGTDESVQQQDKIWSAIKGQIQEERRHTEAAGELYSARRKQKSKRKRWIIPAVAAASILIVMSLPTAPVQALVEQVREWFAPEKTVETEIEGMPSTSVDTLHEGTDQEYVIYFDTTMYKMIQEEGMDKIVLADPPGEPYPEVSMEIYQVAMLPEDAAADIEATLEKDYSKVHAAEAIETPVTGWEVRAVGGTGGSEWNDPIVRYYVFDNEKGGSFIVKQNYFMEAAEGFGSRLQQMMLEFHITNGESQSQ